MKVVTKVAAILVIRRRIVFFRTLQIQKNKVFENQSCRLVVMAKRVKPSQLSRPTFDCSIRLKGKIFWKSNPILGP